MVKSNTHQVTQLLAQWSDGDEAALDELMPIVYDELRRMAKRYMSGQYENQTMQTTELIHEAYLKLAGNKEKNWESRTHFFGVAAQAMRHILVDYARSKKAKKRGGDFAQRITFMENSIIPNDQSEQVVALDDALIKLSEFDERKSRVVELKFFGGLKIEEIAKVLNVSNKTIKRDWKFARIWLLKEITSTETN